MMQEAAGSLCLPVSSHFTFKSIFQTQVASIIHNTPCSDICALQIKLFSSSIPLFPISTNSAFPSELKTCTHKIGDPGNREATTLCLYLGLLEMTETHFQPCDLERKSEWLLEKRSPSVLTRGWMNIFNRIRPTVSQMNGNNHEKGISFTRFPV